VKEASLYGGLGSHDFNGRRMLVFGFQQIYSPKNAQVLVVKIAFEQ
jgi:hypothetical protein